MPTKSLRILIADLDPAQALVIERQLNLLGYYRIAPIHTVEDLMVLRDSPADDFELLLINQQMAGAGPLDALGFCRENPQFKHVFFYAFDASSTVLTRVACTKDTASQCRRLPDFSVIESLMRVIDPGLES